MEPWNSRRFTKIFVKNSMKIALIVCGMPRLLDISYPNFRSNLLQNYNVDVYSYVWQADDYIKLACLFNHKIFSCLKQVDFPKCKSSIYSNWFIKQYACRNFCTINQTLGVKYDFVALCRSDICFNNKIDFSNLDANLLNVADIHWRGTEFFDDNLMITGHDVFQSFYWNLYNWYVSRYDNTDGYCPEEQLFFYAKENGFYNKINREGMLDFTLARAFLR